ncbi:type II and III secretion system protein [Zobellella endophytica]|uniref:Type II and III secretion system protein n=1 Tax=Zobellella endophytica TaxID=2116700 RepID=A0A2P7RD31_9GAMM|nr:pilus assembly protein N-terminal domain-containing protein [Zobellella endophytica]PSJ48137.1 type II and III secretion system protein [Zobellella endophytica]
MKITWFWFFWLCGLAGGAWAQDLVLRQGEQHQLTTAAPVVRAAMGDPEVAGVQVLSSRTLLITGKAAGQTRLLLWQRGTGEPERRLIRVRAAGIAEGNIQVQADIKVVEVSRSALRAIGTGLFKLSVRGNTTINAGSGLLSNFTPGDNPNLAESTLNIFAGNAARGLFGAISALNQSGYAYTLAEPSLVTMSGQTATFLAGGEFPYPSSNDDGEVRIEFKEFGVRLHLTPTVLDDERILLKVAPEVSELDFANGVETAGTMVPSLRIRRTDTTVQLGHGESFVISGLVSSNTQRNADRLPLLGDIPVLGAFFRSSRFDSSDKELLMIVTPHLVRPLAADAALPALPGEAYRSYRPAFFELLFLDRDPGGEALPAGMGFVQGGAR